MDVTAANSRRLAIYYATNVKKQALLRNRSVLIVELFSLGQPHEMDILHRANAKRSAKSNSTSSRNKAAVSC